MKQGLKWGIIAGITVLLTGGVLILGGIIHFPGCQKSKEYLDNLDFVMSMPEYRIHVQMEREDTGNVTNLEWIQKDLDSYYLDDSKKEKLRYFNNGKIFYLREDSGMYLEKTRETKEYPDYANLFTQYRNMAEFLESHYGICGGRIVRIETFDVGNDTFSLYFSGENLLKIQGERHGNPIRCTMKVEMPPADETEERIKAYQQYGRGYQDKEMLHELDIEVEEQDKPAVKRVSLELDHRDDIRNYYAFKSTYGEDWISSEVVGMVGIPVEVKCKEQVSGNQMPKLTFHYDESELECKETELRFMWLDEVNQFYDVVPDYELDADANTISVMVEKPGTYVLEDITIWEAVWNGTYTYEKEIEAQKAMWTKEFDATDILRLADVSLYEEFGKTEFHIETVEQLAGLVRMVNEGESFLNCDFYLEKDLDLAGYKWLPIGWYYPADAGHLWQDFPFEGRFHGQNHVIYNMTIHEPTHSDLGLFGRTLFGFSVDNLGLVDCDIKANLYSGCICGDNISGSAVGMENCFVTGKISGVLDIGALVGSSARMQLKDCYAWMYGDKPCEVLVGDLRGGEMMNCHINDEAAREKLAKYIHEMSGG